MPTVSLPSSLRRARPAATAIESALVRRSVGALHAGRHTCIHCHRTPLVGERVYLFSTRRGEEIVCELCRPLRAVEPDRSVVVRSPEQAGSVRPIAMRT